MCVCEFGVFVHSASVACVRNNWMFALHIKCPGPTSQKTYNEQKQKKHPKQSHLEYILIIRSLPPLSSPQIRVVSDFLKATFTAPNLKRNNLRKYRRWHSSSEREKSAIEFVVNFHLFRWFNLESSPGEFPFAGLALRAPKGIIVFCITRYYYSGMAFGAFTFIYRFRRIPLLGGLSIGCEMRGRWNLSGKRLF